jgi:hypothetical protein
VALALQQICAIHARCDDVDDKLTGLRARIRDFLDRKDLRWSRF